MESPRRMSILKLLRVLTGDVRGFVRQELQLAKTEISEKLSAMARDAAALAVGGFVAYAGLIVLLIGLGWLLAWAFENAGLSPVFAGFLGLAVMGLVVMMIGGALLLTALKAFSKQSLKPERTVHTWNELQGKPELAPQPEPAPSPSSAELQTRVEATQDRMTETVEQLRERLSARHLNAQVKRRIQSKPCASGALAMGAGLLSGFLLKHKLKS